MGAMIKEDEIILISCFHQNSNQFEQCKLSSKIVKLQALSKQQPVLKITLKNQNQTNHSFAVYTLIVNNKKNTAEQWLNHNIMTELEQPLLFPLFSLLISFLKKKKKNKKKTDLT